MPISITGQSHKNTSGNSTTITLSTTAGGVINVACTINGANVSSISSTNTSGWTLRARQLYGSQPVELWWGIASGPLSSEVITLNLTGSSSYWTIDAWGNGGVDTSTVWDSNAALPYASTSNSDAFITTSNANDILFGVYRLISTSTPTAGSGWTLLSGADYQLVEYKIVSSTQASLEATIGTGSGDAGAGIGDAIMAGSSPPPPPPPPLTYTPAFAPCFGWA